MQTFGRFLLAVSLCLATLATLPTASAHECSAEVGSGTEDDCSAPCPDGERHEHEITHHHENGPFPDENHVHYSCRSEKDRDPDRPCSTPKILGICVIDTGGMVDCVVAILGPTDTPTGGPFTLAVGTFQDPDRAGWLGMATPSSGRQGGCG